SRRRRVVVDADAVTGVPGDPSSRGEVAVDLVERIRLLDEDAVPPVVLADVADRETIGGRRIEIYGVHVAVGQVILKHHVSRVVVLRPDARSSALIDSIGVNDVVTASPLQVDHPLARSYISLATTDDRNLVDMGHRRRWEIDPLHRSTAQVDQATRDGDEF